MKKILCFVLSAILIFTVLVPSFVVQVRGIGETLYDGEGNPVFSAENIISGILPVLPQLGQFLMTMDTDVLVDALGVKLLGVGYDHHFGKPCEGECVEQYISYGKSMGVEVVQLSPFMLNGGKVSSTVVRKALVAGDVPLATELLGRKYSLSGSVVSGAGIGRGLGFPTANIQLEDDMKMLPMDGVYEVDVMLDGECYKGVMNIGVKPTIGDNMLRTIEVHIIDFCSDIYGKRITVELVRRLRGELVFANVQALKLQIGVDVARVKRGI